MSERRKPLPSKIKHQLRQRCGYGCVICGIPIYEIHHLDGYSEANCSQTQDLTPLDRLALLCRLHHGEQQRKLLSDLMVEEASNSPFNCLREKSTPYKLHYGVGGITVWLGKFQYEVIDDGVSPPPQFPLVVDGIPLVRLRLENHYTLISILLFDERNELLLSIVDNVIQFSPDNWDIEFVNNRLTVFNVERKKILVLVFDVPNVLIVERASFWCNGINFYVSDGVSILKQEGGFSALENLKASDCNVGIAVGTGGLELAGIAFLFSVFARTELFRVRPIVQVSNFAAPVLGSKTSINAGFIFESTNNIIDGYDISGIMVAHPEFGDYSPGCRYANSSTHILDPTID
jgi:hypothetical protein